MVKSECSLWLNPSIQVGYYINNKLLLARKYARIVVRGYYLFQEANSCPRAKLEGNCELRGTDNVQGQLSVHISEAKSSLSSLLSFEYLLSSPAGGYPRITSAHERTLSGHVSRFHQSRARGNIWWVIKTVILKSIPYWLFALRHSAMWHLFWSKCRRGVDSDASLYGCRFLFLALRTWRENIRKSRCRTVIGTR